MKVLGIIPARYASTRFPGKPLALIHGVSMIERVYRQASRCRRAGFIVVATDDQRIADHVHSFGGNVIMTSPSHESGTDRCAEVAAGMNNRYDVVVNIQGDEPYIYPEQIDQVIGCFENNSVQIATLVKKVNDKRELHHVNIPKVVVDINGNALYFSRRPIPFCSESLEDVLIKEGRFLKHVGIYGYRANVLAQLASLPRTTLEISESLEQLRWLEHGYSIKTALTTFSNLAIDTPDDIRRVESEMPAGK